MQFAAYGVAINVELLKNFVKLLFKAPKTL